MSPEPESIPNVRQAVPFFSVTNMEESYRYYVDGLGFVKKYQWVVEGKLRWCWLELGSAALMLQEYSREGPDSWVPTGKLGEGVVICFQCQDALAIYRAVTRRGLQAAKPVVGNGNWEFIMSSPDGYKIEFESHTDLPEETEFSE